MAGEKGGKDFLLKVETSASVYTTVAGLRSKSFSLSADGIDVTNHGSNQWRELLDGAGIRSMSISGSGVFKNDSTLTTIRQNAMSQTLTNFQIVDDDSGDTFQASFKITSFERSGEFNGEQVWTIALESSGEVTVS